MAQPVVHPEQREIQDNLNFKGHLKDLRVQEQKEFQLLNPHQNTTSNFINVK